MGIIRMAGETRRPGLFECRIPVAVVVVDAVDVVAAREQAPREFSTDEAGTAVTRMRMAVPRSRRDVLWPWSCATCRNDQIAG